MNPQPGGLEGVDGGSWATFHLADELLAIPVADVHEVLMDQPLTSVPLVPRQVLGLVNLRGQILPAIDLRARLRFPPRAAGAPRSLIVVRTGGAFVGVAVDDIGDVLQLPASWWLPPPATLDARLRASIAGICPIERHVVLGLRTRALAAEDEPFAREDEP